MRVPVIEECDSLTACYDVLLCDVWGVIHDGAVAYEESVQVLEQFRKGGGSVILVSNAPLPNHAVLDVLAEKRVRRSAWDAIISSGDMALSRVAERGYRKTYRLGPTRDSALFALLPGNPKKLEDADAIVCTGLVNDEVETALHYLSFLEQALALNLPFICANPDLVVDVSGKRYFCAGSIAKIYEELGGPVHWAGKPFPQIYDAALAKASLLRGEVVDRSRVLAIGDALRTDINGAHLSGIASLFIAGGIHKCEVMRGGRIVEELLEELFIECSGIPLAAMSSLRGTFKIGD